ncbi:endo-1,3(4)-beta-glucanase [Stachybotrys elegans]|uniref:glucan endo-1,3-beta-D-glucosidase n=1 Tax=Stachybotrys elegans TaxID=80388 RepID=A0A8K0SSR4_9HYPO|nr:endo-1,3(4)-beta-glucanase [Stachybotrys elegans]
MKCSAVILANAIWLIGVQSLAVPELIPAAEPSEESHAVIARRDDGEAATYLTSYAPEDIIPTTQTVKLSTVPVPSGTKLVLPSLSDVEPQTTGVPPLLTSPIPSPTSFLQPITKITEKRSGNEPTGGVLEARQAQDILNTPIGTSAPVSSIKRRSDHPQARTGIVKSGPLQTNKFYSNFFLGSQTAPSFTFPYSVAWAKGTGPAASWGMAISHIESYQWWLGPVQYNNAVQYYINPVGIQSMILSAKELGNSTVLNVDSITPFSARVTLKKNATATPSIYFPLVQGMPYLTGRFAGGIPIIQSGVYFKSMTKASKDVKTNVRKYTFLLEDGTTWHVYAYRTSGDPLDLRIVNNGLAQSTKPFYGTVQIAKDPKTTGSETLLDDGAGVFPTTMRLNASISGSTGSYSFTYDRQGHTSGNVYIFALPHHVSSFDSTTKALAQPLKMQTQTKGIATLPGMPLRMSLSPWDGNKGGPRSNLSAAAKKAIRPIALSDVSQDMMAQTNLDSMYFSGKALLKFAQIVYLINDLLGDTALAQAGLLKLKKAYAVFANNQQPHPLVYESAWGGVVSSAAYSTGDPIADFGNTYYNDHHFHYGYHILAAAYIGKMDAAWLTQNRDYVNTLVRDIANPSSKDTWFPQFRNFDWFHGHSWAHGLFESLDGKNQESSSEDMMAAYAVKMWGTVIGDTAMVARANLQMTIMRRSFQAYYLYQQDNKVQPANFIGNKVAGVLHENKVDHSTFFSSNIEAIQGIHMIPVHAPTGYARSKTFIQQEWDVYFSKGRVDAFDNPWKSIAYADYALVNPQVAWNYFNSTSFKAEWIDGGASRSWYMAYVADHEEQIIKTLTVKH